MRVLLTWPLAAFVALSGVGCRKSETPVVEPALQDGLVQKAGELSKEARAELSKLLGSLKQSLDSGELTKAKEVGRQIDVALSQRVVGWYVEVLKIEEKEGVEAAREHLRKLKAAETMTEEERKALDAFETYFRGKGDLKTKEAFEALVKLYLQIKFDGFSGILPHN